MEKNFAPSASRPMNAFETVQQTLSEARDLVIRVDGIIERLLGPTPREGEKSLSPAPQGVLSNMQDDAERTRRFIRDAATSLNRLENALG